MKSYLKLSLGVVFIVLVALYVNLSFSNINNIGFLILAAIFGAYMAMNIGANDVANNVGPAVGSGALTIGGAIIIAAIFESAGALIAGGDVVKTIKKGIIDPTMFSDPMVFVYAMSAALLAAALWLNLATWLKAPVSTTHSIVGGVMGGGIAAAGFAIVSWGTMGKIAASWVISPLLGGVIAALFLYIIKSKIIFVENRLESARKLVPILIAIMSWAFSTYIIIKGIKKLIKIEFPIALSIGLVIAIAIYFLVKPMIEKQIDGLGEDREDINKLFTIPLIFAAILLSFAHGANDVANAVGPLAAVFDALSNMQVSAKASIPIWVMLVGGLGISIGLALFGPRLIKTVGSEITELDHIRAFSIMMAASITVVIASQLGLPVSSTHIAVGAIFGVGFLREWIDSKGSSEKVLKLRKEVEKHKSLKSELKALKGTKEFERKYKLTQDIKEQKKLVKSLKDSIKENYVKRGMVKKIILAWVITVPVAAFISAVIFFIIRGVAS
ncbi:Probable low-affinity inorganic phosphate transporter [hydrothermal vent metagenome]|uniref:Probable low-affinity inorganic phosphate transporter n=1 Tax=hydrothermal vent metagenome TaxID=652676 RepID=A0A1W1EK14_9ZZZZ